MLAFGLLALLAAGALVLSVANAPLWVSVIALVGFMALVGWLSEPGRIR